MALGLAVPLTGSLGDYTEAAPKLLVTSGFP